MELAPFTLEGTHVVLRPLTLEDAPALAQAAAQSRETYGLTWVPEGETGARDYVRTALAMQEAGNRLPFAIVFEGAVAGSTSYCNIEHWRWPAGSPMQGHDRPDAVEVGHTWLAAAAQRTRCNTEAKYLLLKHAFEDWEVLRLTLRTDARNRRSRAAIERIGARLDGVLRHHMPASDGSIRDTASFSILAAEWPDVKRALQARLTD
jgi:RimJ/RimL family protein N-acetyltransferase